VVSEIRKKAFFLLLFSEFTINGKSPVTKIKKNIKSRSKKAFLDFEFNRFNLLILNNIYDR